MSNQAPPKSSLKIVLAAVVILGTVAWLAFTGVRDNKSYYVTITELQGMGNKAYTRHLRVAGNVAPGSIRRVGTNADFTLLEQGRTLRVDYKGAEPPPDTFKDDAPGAGCWDLWARWCVPCHAIASEVRVEVCSGRCEEGRRYDCDFRGSLAFRCLRRRGASGLGCVEGFGIFASLRVTSV